MDLPNYSKPFQSKLKRKRSYEFSEYSSNLYSSSLPSPPYSEENFDGSSDEKELKDNPLKAFSALAQREKSSTPVKSSPFKMGHPNLSKVYPNLMGTPVKSKNKSNKVKDKEIKTKRLKVKCNVCNTNVKEPDMKEHLFFGPVECSDCGWVVQHCSNFSAFNDDAAKIGSDCMHVNLKWKFNPINNFRKWLKYNSEESGTKTFKKVLSAYIQVLYPTLKGETPWDKAINTCNNYVLSNPEKLITPNLGRKNARKLANKIADTNPLNQTNSMKPKKCEKKKRKNYIENIGLPENGFYLIVREAIEECPNCYEELNTKDVRFNIVTWLIHVECKECGLYIYFVLNPPDGSEPKIRILQG